MTALSRSLFFVYSESTLKYLLILVDTIQPCNFHVSWCTSKRICVITVYSSLYDVDFHGYRILELVLARGQHFFDRCPCQTITATDLLSQNSQFNFFRPKFDSPPNSVLLQTQFPLSLFFLRNERTINHGNVIEIVVVPTK